MAPGIGPWTGFHVDPDFAADATWDVGALVEVELWHASKDSPCGTGVVEILRHGPRARLYECRYHAVAVEDPDFGYYALESEASQKPFLLRLAAGKGDDGEVLFKGQDVMPIYRWRVLTPRSCSDLAPIKWLKPGVRKTLAKLVEAGAANNEPEHGNFDEPSARGTAARPVLIAGQRGNCQEELQRLAASVERDVHGEKKKENRSTDMPDSGKQEAEDHGRPRRKESDRKRSRSRRQKEGEPKQRSRSQRASPRTRRGSSDVRPRSTLRSPAPEKGRRRDPGRPSRQNFASSVTVTKAAQGKAKHKTQRRTRSRKRRHRSRGPARGSTRNTSRSSSRHASRRGTSSRSSSRSTSQSFREAFSSQTRGSQARVMAWARKHPGQLAARSLQTMSDRVCREGEAASWGRYDTPAVAKGYYLRVLRPSSGGSLRNQREMHTLCVALDHLGQGRPSFAADLLTRRLMAVEMANRDGNWDRAQFLELIESEDYESLLSSAMKPGTFQDQERPCTKPFWKTSAHSGSKHLTFADSGGCTL